MLATWVIQFINDEYLYLQVICLNCRISTTFQKEMLHFAALKLPVTFHIQINNTNIIMSQMHYDILL